MIHVHPHQETLDPFRISHSSVFKELRLRTTRICVTLLALNYKKEKEKKIPLSPCLDFGEANPTDTAKISIINDVGILNC